MNVGTIVSGLRDQHPAFTLELAPRRTLVNELERWQQRTLERVQAVQARYATQPETFALIHDPTPNYGPDAAPFTFTAPNVMADPVGRIRFRESDPRYRSEPPITWALSAQQFNPGRVFALERVGNGFIVHGTVTDWQGVESITLEVTGQPAPLLLDTDPLVLRDEFLMAAIYHLAAFAGARLVGQATVTPNLVSMFTQLAETEAQRLLMAMNGGQRPRIVQWADVWP